MSETPRTLLEGVIVEEHVEFTLIELGRASGADAEQLRALVDEGALTPRGAGPDDWRFGDDALRRARTALRLTRDLELNPAGAALVLDLLDRIDALEARLRRLGARLAP